MATTDKIIIPRKYRHPAVKLERLDAIEQVALEAIKEFSYSGYTINDTLRAKKELSNSQQQLHDKLLKLIRPVRRELIVWRGISFYAEQDQLPLNDEWIDPSWSSTSLVYQRVYVHADLDRADNPNDGCTRYILKLHVQPGVQIIPTCSLLHYYELKHHYAHAFKFEREFTIAPGHVFEVVSRRQLAVSTKGRPAYTRLDVIVRPA